MKFKSTKVFTAPKSLMSFNLAKPLENKEKPSNEEAMYTQTKTVGLTMTNQAAPQKNLVKSSFLNRGDTCSHKSSTPICTKYVKSVSPPKAPYVSKAFATTGTNTEAEKPNLTINKM